MERGRMRNGGRGEEREGGIGAKGKGISVYFNRTPGCSWRTKHDARRRSAVNVYEMEGWVNMKQCYTPFPRKVLATNEFQLIVKMPMMTALFCVFN